MPLFPRSPISRSEPRRRHDDGDELRTLSFDVESLEFVAAGEELGLLRLAGRWTAPIDRVLADVVLVASAAGESREIAPLPDVNGSLPVATPDGEAWRGAFSLSTALALDEAAEFRLRAGENETIRLPRPGELPEVPLVGPAPVPVEANGHAGPEHDPADDELSRVSEDLARVRTALEVERRRYAALEEEIQTHASLEKDLRNAMAMQEAELAAAAQASERQRRAEAQRERATSPDVPAPPETAGRRLDPDLLERISRARRAAEAA